MGKTIKNILLFIIIAIGLVGTLIVIDYQSSQNAEHSNPTAETFKDRIYYDVSQLLSAGESSQKPEKPNGNTPEQFQFEDNWQQNKLKQTAWIPNWAFRSGVESLKENPQQFYSVSPVLYNVNADGTLKDLNPSGLNEMAEICRDNNIKIIPSIALFDWERLTTVLNDETSYQNHIDAIVSEIETNNWDGIDLDYESIIIEDKELYLTLLEDLAEILHKDNKMLSVTVVAKWGDNVIYPSLPQTRAVQDWEIISEYADEIRIMSYDYTYFGSENPGPIAPMYWMMSVYSYAIEKIPKEKIWMGIHLYSYEWRDANPDLPEEEKIEAIDELPDKASSYVYSRVQEIIEEHEITSYHQTGVEEGYAQYDCDEKFVCMIYFQDQFGILARTNLAKKFGLEGVAYWKLGGEGDLL
ncbi:hypothetical protein GF357_04175 [Candidatus Dojkabacteria bacterium]|nr:hypothetical protein [Candidatus Dojkabacteria bacterium]